MKALSRKFKSKIKHKNVENKSEISEKKNEASQNFLVSEIETVSEDKASHNENKEEVNQATEQTQEVSKISLSTSIISSSLSSPSLKSCHRDAESIKPNDSFGKISSRTSFASSLSSGNFEPFSSGSFAFVPDEISLYSDASRRSSFDSLSFKHSRSPSVLSLSSATSEQYSSSRAQSQAGRTPLSPVFESKAKSGSGIWKKLPFHRKIHPLKKQSSLNNLSSKDDEDSSNNNMRSNSICSGDFRKSENVVEKLLKVKTDLEIEVRGKDEEVRMLSATISQVNMSWENRVQEVMEDLENAQRQNRHLRVMLAKEAAAAQANVSKPARRVPVSQTLRRRKSQENDEDTLENRNSENGSSTTPSFTTASPIRNGTGKTYFETGRTKNASLIKTKEVKRRLMKVLSSSKCLSQLSPDHLESIAEAMTSKRINKGERLMQEGMLARAFYVLAEGACVLYKQHQNSSDSQEIGRPIQQWEIFGESDVYYHSQRVWSCKCTRQGLVWLITREAFRSTIKQQDIHRRKLEIYNFLKEVKYLEKVETHQLKEIANVSRVVQFANGDYIIRQGSKIHHVYILKDGEVATTKIIDGAETRKSKYPQGEIFGRSNSTGAHEYNVIATGKEVVQCVVIPSKYFDRVRDHVTCSDDEVTPDQVQKSLAKREVKENDETVSASSGYTGSGSSGYGSEMSQAKKHLRRYSITHSNTFEEKSRKLKGTNKDGFNVITTIGHGAFGVVELVSSASTNDEVFAVKKIAKYEVVAAEQQQNIFNEKNLQMESSRLCPFIASLYSTFKDDRYVYFVMEFCAGGELFSLLSQANAFDEKMARFYAGCAVEALAFLHSRRILFRDLKPENVVFDQHGYCKLTDFGFAKKLSLNSTLRTYTFCGTTEYMAPEILLYQAQTFSVDLWTLGIFIFEMLNGKAPFKSKNREALANSILQGIEPKLKIALDSHRISTTAASLIKALCHVRPEDRLGSSRAGISDVTKHSWFHKLNWNALRKRTLPSPWKPKLSNLQDTRYFSPSSKPLHRWNTCAELSGWDENF